MSKMIERRIVLTEEQHEAYKRAADGRPLARFVGLLALKGFGVWQKEHPATEPKKGMDDGTS